MQIPWTFLIALGFVGISTITIFDIMFAFEGDASLAQYEVEPINPILNVSVLQHLSESSGKIKVGDDQIGQTD